MISLRTIELNEERTGRDVVYMGGSPVGKTAGRTHRTISIVLTVDDASDIDRVHVAVALLVRPPTDAPTVLALPE